MLSSKSWFDWFVEKRRTYVFFFFLIAPLFFLISYSHSVAGPENPNTRQPSFIEAEEFGNQRVAKHGKDYQNRFDADHYDKFSFGKYLS